MLQQHIPRDFRPASLQGIFQKNTGVERRQAKAGRGIEA